MNNFSRNITIYIAYIIFLHAITPHYHAAGLAWNGKYSNSFCLLEDLLPKKHGSYIKQNHSKHSGVHLNHELETGNYHDQKKLISPLHHSIDATIVDLLVYNSQLPASTSHQRAGFINGQFIPDDGHHPNYSLRGPPTII